MATLLFSRACSYAIRALTYLAMQPAGKLSGTREISDHEGIPHSFLCKVLLQARRKRLLRSHKGIGGGYELALPAQKISLRMIIHSFDEDVAFDECLLENRSCLERGQCPLHEPWRAIREQLVDFLERNTLAELVRQRQATNGQGAADTSPAGWTGYRTR